MAGGQDTRATFQKAEGIDPLEAHDFELFLEGGNGRACQFVGRLLGNAQCDADFTVGLAVTDALGHEPESGRKRRHCHFEPFPGFEGGSLIGERAVAGGNLLDARLRGGGGLGGRKIEIVNMVSMMPHLAFVEIPQSVSHGTGSVGGEVALGRIEKPSRMGESLLGGEFYLSMRQSGDVIELPGDFCSERKEFMHPLFHDGEKLSGCRHAGQAHGSPDSVRLCGLPLPHVKVP